MVLFLILIPICTCAHLLGIQSQKHPLAELFFSAFILYLVIGGRSLSEHSMAVKYALDSGNLGWARTRVGYMVSRETGGMTEEAVSIASIESVLENGSDSIFAPIFWFVLGGLIDAGPTAVIGYRIINTLDAMWGYRSDRFFAFGWAAARFDDIVNFIPARLCAVSYATAVVGKCAGSVNLSRQAVACWWQQASSHDSPNAGPVMACGAGALNVKLGGPVRYGDKAIVKAPLGIGLSATPHDIVRSLHLVKTSVLIWVVSVGIVAVVTESFQT